MTHHHGFEKKLHKCQKIMQMTCKCQETQKIDGNNLYWKRKSSYFLNDFRNLYETYSKDVTYDNIKCQKKGFTFSLDNISLEKPQGDQISPASLGLRRSGLTNFTDILNIKISIAFFKTTFKDFTKAKKWCTKIQMFYIFCNITKKYLFLMKECWC